MLSLQVRCKRRTGVNQTQLANAFSLASNRIAGSAGLGDDVMSVAAFGYHRLVWPAKASFWGCKLVY